MYVYGEAFNPAIVLENSRKLLKPNGKLVAFAATSPSLSKNQSDAVSITDDDDYLLRESGAFRTGPFQSLDENNLIGAGFSGLDLEFRDIEDDMCCATSLIISTNLQLDAKPVSQSSDVILLIRRGSPLQLHFAKILEADLVQAKVHLPQVIELGDDSNPSQFRGQLCVSLLEYEEPFLSNITSDEFSCLKAILSVSKIFSGLLKMPLRCVDRSCI